MRLALLLLPLASCSLLGVATGDDRALADARARWAAAGPRDYTVTLSVVCFCPPEWAGPFEVTVARGAVASVTRDGAPVPADRGLTVEDVFDRIERALDGGTAEVTYDAATGMPLRARLDPVPNAVDDEQTYTLAHLRPR